jgi:excisionase family DNA binding protein
MLMTQLLSTKELAKRLGCTDRHVQRLESNGEGPPSIKLGRLRRYPEDLADEWVKKKIEGVRRAPAD